MMHTCCITEISCDEKKTFNVLDRELISPLPLTSRLIIILNTLVVTEGNYFLWCNREKILISTRGCLTCKTNGRKK